MSKVACPDDLPVASTDGIVAWSVDTDDVTPDLLRHLASFLSPEEQARAARFVFERHRGQHVVAHALKRLMLSRQAGGAPRAWVFVIGPHGKPSVAGAAHLHFNLSHCEGLVACAVSLSAPIGIDVERRGQAVPWVTPGRDFAAVEQAWLGGLPEAARPDGFVRLWTLKEAFIKATGLGLTQSLGEFAIRFDPLRLGFSDPALGAPTTWRLHQELVGASHVFAAAWQPGPEKIKVAPVPIDALVNQCGQAE